jgi:hypothetical protein
LGGSSIDILFLEVAFSAERKRKTEGVRRNERQSFRIGRDHDFGPGSLIDQYRNGTGENTPCCQDETVKHRERRFSLATSAESLLFKTGEDGKAWVTF